MIPLAIGLGILGFMALRRARHCGGHHHYGWHGPWSDGGRWNDHGYGHGGGPPWRRGRHRRGRRWMLHAALARIDATPAQERVIVGELERLQERVHGAKDSLGEARVDLSAAMRGPALDDAALGAVLGRVDAASADVRAAAIEALRTIHGVLDDKQRAQVADMLDGRGGWRRGGPYR